jgi:hypothetical protein
MDLIVFGGDEQCGNSKQLKVTLVNACGLEHKNEVYHLYANVHSFMHYLKLFANLQQPP